MYIITYLCVHVLVDLRILTFLSTTIISVTFCYCLIIAMIVVPIVAILVTRRLRTKNNNNYTHMLTLKTIIIVKRCCYGCFNCYDSCFTSCMITMFMSMRLIFQKRLFLSYDHHHHYYFSVEHRRAPNRLVRMQSTSERCIKAVR